MKNEELRITLDFLGKHVGNFNFSRAYNSYLDLLNLDSLAEKIDEEINNIGDIRALQNPKDDEKYEKLFILQEQGVTLLKAIYMFSDVFVKILLGELAQIDSKSKGELSLNQFLSQFSNVIISDSQKEVLNRINVDKLLPAYCVCIYRNKVVSHHGKTRNLSYTWASKKQQCVLSPLPENGQERETLIGLALSREGKEKFEKLWEKYKPQCSEWIEKQTFRKSLFSDSLIRKELSQQNPAQNIKMELLFYNVPLGSFDKVNQDRFMINNVVEEGLCPSMNRSEIIHSLDTLIKEVVRVFS